MKVLHVNTDDSRGGAARAALRLHSALRDFGIDSRFLVKDRTGHSDHVPNVYAASSPAASPYGDWIHKHYVHRNLSEAAKSLFSLGLPGVSVEGEEQTRAADVINLHWVCHFLGPREIGALLRLGKPVLWTLHDQWAMTAGCHYTGDCTRYQNSCGGCPQLQTDAFGIVEAGFRDRLDSFTLDVTLVTPSEWMARRARASRIFSGARVEVIPNCIDERVFRPKSKRALRADLGLPADAVVILFACSAAFERRKGAALFKRLADELRVAPELKHLNVWAMHIGWHTEEHASALPEKHLGFLNDDGDLCDAFNAADFVVNLSTEDNLPNMVIEAMSCGTPVLALRTGGLPEIIEPLVSGLLVPLNDFQALREAAIRLVTDAKARQGLGEMARLTVEKKFGKAVAPGRYAALYQELLDRNPAPAPAPLPSSKMQIETKLPALVTHAFKEAEQLRLEQQQEIKELRSLLRAAGRDHARRASRSEKRRFSQRLKSVFNQALQSFTRLLKTIDLAPSQKNDP